ncbi:MAG: hypothetical protein GAK45_02540 [Pseudomonas citronellolis]|nr:MAG: hypothetical protein GAK45_02540 [Pseudomonas citronellolis]
MRFLVIVKATPGSEAGLMPSAERLAAMAAYDESLAKAGVLLGGEGVQPSSNGARVHFDGERRSVLPGPFAHPQELVAGFWIFRTESLEACIEWVRRCPNPFDSPSDIEIRPLFEAEDFGDSLSPELREQEARLRAEIAGKA